MKIGIYGGTFNPPHLGHMAAAQTAVSVLGLDKLILIPAATPPHKVLPAGAPTPRERLAMTELMADNMNLPGIVEVSAMELEREGKSYTSDTLAAIRKQFPDAQLWLLMGTDMFLTLQYWHEPEKITQLAGICAFGRTQQDGEELFAPQSKFLHEKYNANVTTITLPNLIDISSTRLRQLLARGEGREFLAPAIYGHILMKGMYNTDRQLTGLPLPELRACACSMVRAKRIAHIRGTEEEAARLAQRWGANEQLARRAAILHDCTKYWELDRHLELCRRYDLELDELERSTAKLLHSKTGACIAKYVFGEPEEVYRSIFWHTTGKADMSLLEKIIYLADYIEPTREFDGLEQLRRMAYQNLDKALLLGMNMNIKEMEQRGKEIHRNTLAARNWLQAAAE